MDPVSTTPTAMRFGNDVVVPEPSTTNTKNYTVLDSDAAKQDYQTKNSWLSNEQNSIINQSLQNQQNAATTKSTSDANGATKSVADSINGATKALTGGSGTDGSTTSTKGTTSNGNTYNITGNAYVDSLAANSADMQAMYTQTQAKLLTASTAAGLSPDQQSQLSSLSANYDDLISKQTQANTAQQGGETVAEARSGTARYAQTVALSNMTRVVNDGLSKIATLTNQKQDALNKMSQAFISDNVKAVNNTYKAYQDMSHQITQNIKDVHQAILDQQTEQDKQQQIALDQQKQQATFLKDNNVVSPFYQLAGSSVVYDSKTGQAISSDEYKQMGGAGGDYKDIQQISPGGGLQSAPGKEYEDYLKTLPKGQKPLDFNSWENMDSNRKATKVNNITYNQSKDQAQTQAASMVGSGLAKKVGSDGYVSPSDFKSALAAWTSDGYAAKDFYDQFKNYINPADTNILTGVSDYGAYK